MILLSLACAEPSPPPSVTDTAPPGTTDTVTPTDPVDVGISNVGHRVHADFPTLVYATWDQGAPADVHVEYSFDAGVWLSSPARSLDAGAHEEILLGIPYGTTVTFRVVADGAPSEDVLVAVDAAPPQLPDHELLVFDEANADLFAAPYFWTALALPSGVTFACVFDAQGRPVWSKRLPNNRTSLHPRVAKDGRSLYLDYNSYWQIFDQGAGSTVDQMLLDGTVLHTFDTPGLHHPFTDLPDGSLAYGETSGSYANESLTIVHPDGSVDRLWDCEAWLADIGSGGFCSSNTLNYDPATDKYLFSFWSLETIVEVDGATGAVDRWFGHVDGAYAFDPIASTFWWQHGGYITEAGTLLTSSDLTTNGDETVLREYEIDDAAQTLREVWSFGVGQDVYGYQMGEGIRLPGGNTLHNYGELPRLREVTPDGVVVRDIEFTAEFIGRSMPIADLYALVGERP